jgi:hypothetical protein
MSSPRFDRFHVDSRSVLKINFNPKVQDVWSNALASRPRGMVVDIQHGERFLSRNTIIADRSNPTG